jgi:hypothetical protein
MATKTTEPKLTASEKRAQKRRETAAQMEQVFGTGKGSTEPTLNPLDYTASLMRALNYYNSAFENKDKRKWFMSYVGKKSTEFDSLPDWDFRSVGTIIRLKQREQPLNDKDLQFIEDSIAELRLKAKGEQKVSALKGAPKEKEVKPVVSIQDRIAEAASGHIGEINGMIDDFVTSDTEIDVGSYLKANNVSPQVSKLIPAAFAKTIEELNEVIEGSDKQLVEGYSHIKKIKIKRLIKSLESISDACAQQAVSAKAARKPRAKKEKPASVVAKAVKYMKEFPELKLTSEKPEKIIGSSEVWIYNTKYKKIQVYRSLGTLGIKGTTILNYDVATSGAKTMRKPELVTGYADLTKRNLANEFKNLKTKEAAVNGRINEECIILRIFS